MSEGQQSVTTGATNPIPVGFEALPALDVSNPNFTRDGNRLLAELRAKGPVCRVEPDRRHGFPEVGRLRRDFARLQNLLCGVRALGACAGRRGRDQDRHAAAGRPAEAHSGQGAHATGLHARAGGCDGAAHPGNHAQAHRRHPGEGRRVRLPPWVRPSASLDGDVGPLGRRRFDGGDVLALGQFDDGRQHGPRHQGRCGAAEALRRDRARREGYGGVSQGED